jgi:hypothetical protein
MGYSNRHPHLLKYLKINLLNVSNTLPVSWKAFLLRRAGSGFPQVQARKTLSGSNSHGTIESISSPAGAGICGIMAQTPQEI